MKPPKRKYYTGVGSRQTPSDVLALMTKIAVALDRRGFTLRSGHAVGADRAFEHGAHGNADIYLPWPGFGTKPYKDDPGEPVLGNSIVPHRDELFDNYDRLVYHGVRNRGDAADAVKLLHGRNWCQVFGHTSDAEYSKLVVCWTPSGLESWDDYNPKDPQGGTATAILMAALFKIPVFNLANSWALDELKKWLRENNHTPQD